MSTADPIFEALTGQGTPFEIGEEGGMRQFVNAPANLDAMIESARMFADRVFIVEGGTRYSYDDVFVRRDALAAALAIDRGDRVAIAMRNRSAWIVAFLAIIRAGGVAVLLNSRGSPAELQAAVEDCDVSLVLADAERATLLREGGCPGTILEDRDFPESGAFNGPAFAASADDAAAILFTSGTTGRVKGAVLTHRNLITGLVCVQLSSAMVLHNVAQQYGISPEAIMAGRPQPASLLVFPLFHISGLGSGFISQMLAGAKIVVMDRWDPEEALRLIPEERITMLTAVPTMLWDLLHRARLGSTDISSLTQISSGGQALPINLLDAVTAACPSAFMGTGFGLTETAGPIAMATGPDFLRKRASAGRVLALADVRVLDEAGAPLPQGATGEIAVRGPMVMKGYWNRAGETEAVLSADGWFRSGDVGYVDDEGYIFIVDRKKDMVISGGENIYCAEVERVMSEIAQVAECAAFGLPDDRLGERLVAVVVAGGIAEADVKRHIGENLARYKVPARVAISSDPLPRNAVGKVDKIKLRTLWPVLSGEE